MFSIEPNPTPHNKLSMFIMSLGIIAWSFSYFTNVSTYNVKAESLSWSVMSWTVIDTTSWKTNTITQKDTPVSINNDKTFWTNLESMYWKYKNLVKENYSPIRVRLSTPTSFKEGYTISCKNDCLIVMNGQTFTSKTIGFQKLGSNKVKVVLSLNNSTITQETEQVNILTKQPWDTITLNFWDRTLDWDKTKKQNDNIVVGGIDVRNVDNQVIIVNELDFYDYMRGIAEVPEGDQDAKRETLYLIAGSYAKYYQTTTTDIKFPGMWYNASDNPDLYQKYRGYNFTLRSSKWQWTVSKLQGKFIYYKWKVLRTAFYSCTPVSGKTLTPKQKGWNSKYFESVEEVYQSVEDQEWVDLNRANKWQCGHWVGLSWYWATKKAEKGWDYQKILNYYYKNIDIK